MNICLHLPHWKRSGSASSPSDSFPKRWEKAKINTQEPERKRTPHAPEDFHPWNRGGGGEGGGGRLWMPYKCEADAPRKIQIKPQRDISVLSVSGQL